MPIHMIGSGGQSPFDRTFFNVTLGDLIERFGKEKKPHLMLYLVDSATLEVCNIDDIGESYVTVRAFNKDDDTCELSLNLIPYSLIYRIELSPHDQTSPRMGFTWNPTAKKKS